ncbi:hypothetical protein [Phyllobacterium chamaecytisi]|uniref:hypothetical protein n=1 Tax=Phyllobacterium chamaecytisi TaxID=2876082 RepID=UPI001CCB03B5|nr:hypothetical protein [Phyllobacterium sp. KW56]MBZ9603941.1 hypothetical protein [Phyllobacterium sp. KW56]
MAPKKLNLDEVIALAKSGRMDEAKAGMTVLIQEAKYSPTRIVAGKDGIAKFYKGKARVEKGPDGVWRLMQKP